jgi:CheY-like chemotaxis protein
VVAGEFTPFSVTPISAHLIAEMGQSLNSINDRIVLVAEDDEDTRILLARAFRKVNSACVLKVATNGLEVIRYLEGKGEFADRDSHPLPAMMLLDLNMPQKSGFEVLQWIRRHPSLKRMVVVVFTHSENQKDIDRAYDLGANSYLIKSPSSPEFFEFIKNLDVYWSKHNRGPVDFSGCW